MSPIPNPLRTNKLSVTLPGMALHLADNARVRVRDEMQRKNMSQREMADLLDCSQSKIAKLLTGRIEMTVNDLEQLCFAVGLSPVEAIRDRGLEFCAELTPTMLRRVERMGQMAVEDLDALDRLLRITTHTQRQERAAKLPKSFVNSKRK